MRYKGFKNIITDASYWKLIPFYFFLLFFFILPVEIIQHNFFPETLTENSFSSISENKYYALVMAVIVGPVLETFIFQIIPIRASYYILRNSFKNKPNVKTCRIWSIIISSVFFGFSHFFSFFYIVVITIFGLYLGLIYYYFKERKKNPFYPIVMIHALYNLTVIFLSYMTFF